MTCKRIGFKVDFKKFFERMECSKLMGAISNHILENKFKFVKSVRVGSGFHKDPSK